MAPVAAIENDLSNFVPEEVLTSEELIELRITFELLDNDGNGEITVQELQQQMSKNGSFSADAMERAISKIDVNNDGVISFEEFCLAKALAKQNVLRVNDLKELESHFQLFDSDGSGTIESSEIMAALQEMGMPVDDQTMRAVMSSADVDGDGEIDFDEFVQLTKGVYTLIERKFEICTMKTRLQSAIKEVEVEWKKATQSSPSPQPLDWPWKKKKVNIRGRRGSEIPKPKGFRHTINLYYELEAKEKQLKHDIGLMDSTEGIAGMLQLYKSYMVSFRTSESVLDSLCELMKMFQIGSTKSLKDCLGNSGRQCDIADAVISKPDMEILKKKEMDYEDWVESVMVGSAIFADTPAHDQHNNQRRASVSTRSIQIEKQLKATYMHYSRTYATDKVGADQMGSKAWEMLCKDVGALAGQGQAVCNTIFMTFTRTPIGGVDLAEFRQTNDPNRMTWGQFHLATSKLLSAMTNRPAETVAGRELENLLEHTILKNAQKSHFDPLVEHLTEPPVKSMLFRRLWTLKFIFNHYAADVDANDPTGPSGFIGLRNMLELFKNFKLFGSNQDNLRSGAAGVSQESISRAFHAVEPARLATHMLEDTQAVAATMGETSSFTRRSSQVHANDDAPAHAERVQRPRLVEQGSMLNFAGFIEVICRCSLLFFPLQDVQQQIKLQQKNENLIVFHGNNEDLKGGMDYIAQNLDDFVNFTDEQQEEEEEKEGGEVGGSQVDSTTIEAGVGSSTVDSYKQSSIVGSTTETKSKKKTKKKKGLVLKIEKKPIPHYEEPKTRIISPRSKATLDRKFRLEQASKRKMKMLKASGTPTASSVGDPWAWVESPRGSTAVQSTRSTTSSAFAFTDTSIHASTTSNSNSHSNSHSSSSPRRMHMATVVPRGTGHNRVLRVGGAPPLSPRGTDKFVHRALGDNPDIVHSIQATMPTPTDAMHLPQRQKPQIFLAAKAQNQERPRAIARVPRRPTVEQTVKSPWGRINHSFPRYSRAHSRAGLAGITTQLQQQQHQQPQQPQHGGTQNETAWAQTLLQEQSRDYSAPPLLQAPLPYKSRANTAEISAVPETTRLPRPKELRDHIMTQNQPVSRKSDKVMRGKMKQQQRARQKLRSRADNFWRETANLDAIDKIGETRHGWKKSATCR